MLLSPTLNGVLASNLLSNFTILSFNADAIKIALKTEPNSKLEALIWLVVGSSKWYEFGLKLGILTPAIISPVLTSIIIPTAPIYL